MVASLSSYDGVGPLIVRPSDSKNLLNILVLLTPVKNALISEPFVCKATPVCFTIFYANATSLYSCTTLVTDLLVVISFARSASVYIFKPVCSLIFLRSVISPSPFA